MYIHILLLDIVYIASRNRWIATIPGNLHCNIYSLGPAKALLVQAATEPVGYVGICNTADLFKGT